MNVAILTDTNSGITEQEAAEMGIHVMPMPVVIEEEIHYEGRDLTEEQFYSFLTSDRKVSTSQPSPGDLLAKWDELLENGFDQIVYIPMSSGLSNSCHSAIGFAGQYEGKVFVADNHRISVTLRDSVVKAKKLAGQGKDGSEIKELLEQEAYQSSIYISVNTLKYLQRGGRITQAAAMIGTVLNIKPILTIQGGKLDSFAKARSMKRCEAQMIDAIRHDIQTRFPDIPMEQLSIGGAGTALTGEQRDRWLQAIKDAFPGAKVYYNPLSLSIGCHTGPGAVGIGVSIL